MTAKDLLEINGSYHDSPLIETVRRLDRIFTKAGAPYAVIGGMAVVRNGAPRTTYDVDVLATREGWEQVRTVAADLFETSDDSARDRTSAIHIDVLFAGDDWEMVIPLPHPADVAVFDKTLGARFMDLEYLIELKCAVYLAKRRSDGLELAAKDLADVVALVRANAARISREMVDSFHPATRRVLRRVIRRVRRSEAKRSPP